MSKNNPLSQKDLDMIRTEQDALDQSIALNRIVMTMLDAQKRSEFWIRILLLVSLVINVIIVGIFVLYESQMETSTQTETYIEQDTGEGSGNNVYQAGSNAKYIQGTVEGVTDGEADYSYSEDHNSDEVK